MQQNTTASKKKKPRGKYGDMRILLPAKYNSKIRAMANGKGIPVRTMAKILLIELLDKASE